MRDDALVELGPAGQRVGGRVEGTQAELGVPGDGQHLVHAGPGEAGSDRERLRRRAGGQGERDAEGAGRGQPVDPVIVGRRPGEREARQASLVRAEHAEECHLDGRGVLGPFGEADLQPEVVDLVGAQDVCVGDERPVEAADPDRRDRLCPVFPAGRRPEVPARVLR